MKDLFDRNDSQNKPPKKAAMYARMSTDHQKYSIDNQTAAITHYAAEHNMEIVANYIDDGKSGLDFDGREALQRIINDVKSGVNNFSVILVLDVSRWGRFQDPDEAAYYEYKCRRAGLEFIYVNEQFENDGSPMATVVKGLKRAMAGEYSRELSGKVFAGQCRLIEMGYRQGGPAGYGLRRMLINERGEPKAELGQGEHKSLQTDRVILVPGPKEEVEIVRWIYGTFTEDGWRESEIAAVLNRRGVMNDLGRPWSRGTIHEILINEKYIGNNVFNRTSYKLKSKRVNNPPEIWVRSEGAFEAIVEPRYFYTAQGIIRARSQRLSDEELLNKLKALRQRNGWLSGIVIDEAEDMPSSSAYQHRFGSLIRAYQLIDYTPDRDYRYIEINRHLRKLYASVVEDTIQNIKKLGATVHREVTSDLIFINNELKLSMVICRCQYTKTGSYRWKIHLDSGLQPDITIAIRMDANNEQVLDYYVLPALDVENPKMRLAEENGMALDTYRFDRLEPFYMLTERVTIKGAA